MRAETGAVDAVILAGGVNETPVYEGHEPGLKALLPIGDRLAIEHVLAALRAVPAVKRIAVVGPMERLRAALDGRGFTDLEFVPGGDTVIDDIYRGLGHFPDAANVLVTTADIPLLSANAVMDFLAGCATVELTYAENMFLAVVPQRSYTGPFASVQQTFNRFKDAAIRYGNLFLVDPRLTKNTTATRKMNALYHARKHPLSPALAFGLHLGLEYVLGVHMWHLLTLDHMAQMASRRFGFGLIPILLEHPGVTITVDEPADYAFIHAELSPEPADLDGQTAD